MASNQTMFDIFHYIISSGIYFHLDDVDGGRKRQSLIASLEQGFWIPSISIATTATTNQPVPHPSSNFIL